MTAKNPLLATWITVATFALIPVTFARIPPRTVVGWGDDDGGVGSITKTVSGHFREGLEHDVFTIKGGEIVQMLAPSIFADHSPTRLLANDIARFAGAGENGQDALLFVDASGLFILPKIYLEPTYSPEPWGTLSWGGASRIEAADSDGDGVDDTVVGISLDGKDLLIEGPLASYSIACSTPIIDLAIGHYNGTAVLQIAMLAGNQVEIVEFDGAEVRTFVGLLEGGFLANVRGANGVDRVAWLGPISANDHALWVLSADGLDDDVPQFLGGLGPVAMSTADADGDGDDDLVISSSIASETLLVANQRSATQGSVTSFPITIPTTYLFDGAPYPPVAGNVAAPVIVGDIDRGGAEVLHIAHVGSTPPATNTFEVPFGPTPAIPSLDATVLPDIFGNNLFLTIVIPPFPSEYDTLEMTNYRQADAVTPVSFEPLQRLTWGLEQSGSLSLLIPIPQSPTDAHEIFNLVFRLVELDATGAVVRAMPPRIIAVAEHQIEQTLLESEVGGAAYVDFSAEPGDGGGAGERPIILPAGTGENQGTGTGGGTGGGT